MNHWSAKQDPYQWNARCFKLDEELKAAFNNIIDRVFFYCPGLYQKATFLTHMTTIQVDTTLDALFSKPLNIENEKQ